VSQQQPRVVNIGEEACPLIAGERDQMLV
ncbi:MAG: hypothetical protein ACI97K_002727, partial [Glaciecola sp.]